MKHLSFNTPPTLFILLIFSCLMLVISSCASGDTETAASTEAEEGTGDLAGLVFEDIPGSTIKYARQFSDSGQLEIEGFVENGKKTGQWIQYTPEGDISLINNYVDGLLEGTALRMSFRNQVDLKTTFKKNQLNGPWTAYKYGKIIEQRNYKDHKLDGIARTYEDRTFKLKQEVEYKDGVQHGYFRYYDEEGNVSLEYQYENGEKISGGIIEK